MAALKPYPAYRESGLPWLGQVPEHWDVRRNGRMFAQRIETGYEELPILEVSLRTGVRVRDMDNGVRKQQMTDRSKYKRAAKGDVAYNMMRMWQGAVGVAPKDGLISPAYVVARPYPEVEPRYYSYLFRTADYMQQVNKFSRGIVSDRNRLYWDEFKQMPSAFLPTEEQTAIANFLDAHGRRTAHLIRNKRRLIVLLNEQKLAIINQAVTRGLDPNAPMKATGIEWMPEIPAHWAVRRLFSSIKSIIAGQWGDDPVEENSDEHIICVRVADFNVKSLSVSEKKLTIRAISLNAQRSRLLEYGDILLEKSGGGDAEPVGRVVMFDLDRPSVTSNFISRLQPDRSVANPRFLLYVLALLQATRRNVPSIKQTTGIQNIDERNYLSNLFGVPSMKEQEEIVSFVDASNTMLDQTISRAEREIELIQKYRERLIADIVTGKLDVRDVAVAMAGADDVPEDTGEEIDDDLIADEAEPEEVEE